jgi:tryptophan 7-halogenase
MIKDILVLGGGTSGLVAALTIKTAYPDMTVELVKSSSIGIIGVGEGSTEHWSKFMEFVGISVYDLIRETGATFKSGIKFDDWNGLGHSYMHSLSTPMQKRYVSITPMFAYVVANGLPAEELLDKSLSVKSLHQEINLEQSVNQYHFDTNKLNEFFLKQCESRGVVIIDAVVKDVNLDQEGYVESLLLENGDLVVSDFFVDCSGLTRVIGSKLGMKWQSVQEYLPMNSAIAFPTDRTEEIPSHTVSRAMSSGWMWRIPTQDRYGNGYVYCDKFITEEQAVAEAQSLFKEPIQIGKKIKFDAGYVDKFWIKNCVALGLSGSFFEPLEATSIGTSIQQSFALISGLISWSRDDEIIASTYNEQFTKVMENILDFVQLHYITKRNDTEFWKFCKTLKLTEFNKKLLPLFKKSFPTQDFFQYPHVMFKDQNWIQVMHGLELFDIDSIKTVWNSFDFALKDSAKIALDNFNAAQAHAKLITHRQALEILKTRYAVSLQKA